MVEIIVTGEFAEWYGGLAEQDGGAVYDAVEFLATRGLALGHPQSSAIKGSRFAIRELRIQSGGRAVRVFYAFDPKRQAVLIIGGTKADGRFYDKMVPVAERIWAEYLDETK